MAKPKSQKPANPDKPLTTNQMIAMFREVLEQPVVRVKVVAQ